MYSICNYIFINIIKETKFLNKDLEFFTHSHIQEVLLFRDLLIFQFFENLYTY